MIENIKKFPAIFTHTPERKHDPPDAPTYRVEVFGRILDGTMVVYRDSVAWVDLDIKGVEILPLEDFKRKYWNFKRGVK